MPVSVTSVAILVVLRGLVAEKADVLGHLAYDIAADGIIKEFSGEAPTHDSLTNGKVKQKSKLMRTTRVDTEGDRRQAPTPDSVTIGKVNHKSKLMRRQARPQANEVDSDGGSREAHTLDKLANSKARQKRRLMRTMLVDSDGDSREAPAPDSLTNGTAMQKDKLLRPMSGVKEGDDLNGGEVSLKHEYTNGTASLLASGGPRRSGDRGGLKTTRYWDCCKPSCAWNGKAAFNAPVQTCQKDGWTRLTDTNRHSGCGHNKHGASFTCANQQPWYDPATKTSYATAASHSDGMCSECYRLKFHGKPDLVVQVTNIGGDVGGNQFDILVPGGGFGLFDGCTYQFGANEHTWGNRYGGVMAKYGGGAKGRCGALPQGLRPGCEWIFWYGDNPHAYQHYRVTCPQQLVAKTGSRRNDDYSFGWADGRGGGGGGGGGGGVGGAGGGGDGCCSWDGHKCGNCGRDGSGWCHKKQSHCARCTGRWISKTPPSCRGGGAVGCCSWHGRCGNCGHDGSGWCHKKRSHCTRCTGRWISKTPPSCR